MAVTATTVKVGVPAMPAGRVRSVTFHTHSVRTRHAAAMAGVLTARVCVHLASEDFTVSMVSSSLTGVIVC